MKHTRRTFLKTAMSGAVASVVTPVALGNTLPKSIVQPTIISQKVFGANDRIRIAVLGVNGRGQNHIEEIMKQPNAVVATLCDPDMELLKKRARSFEEKYAQKVLMEQDLRKVFEDKNIDAVTLATPNHWHALQAIWACQAGKDVYVEKPATHNIYEGKNGITNLAGTQS